jgi:hypothetical protein
MTSGWYCKNSYQRSIGQIGTGAVLVGRTHLCPDTQVSPIVADGWSNVCDGAHVVFVMKKVKGRAPSLRDRTSHPRKRSEGGKAGGAGKDGLVVGVEGGAEKKDGGDPARDLGKVRGLFGVKGTTKQRKFAVAEPFLERMARRSVRYSARL